MVNNDIDAKLKAIEEKYKQKVQAIRMKRNEDLSKLRKSIDMRRVEKISKEIKENI